MSFPPLVRLQVRPNKVISIVNEEFSEIAANIHHERSIGATSYIDCFRSGGAAKTRKRVLVRYTQAATSVSPRADMNKTGIGLQALQQLTGVRQFPSGQGHRHAHSLICSD